MRGAASLRKKRQTLSLPPTCTQLVQCEKGKFPLDGSFSKNAAYKQKIIFHLRSIDKMSQKKIFFAWTVDWWYKQKITFHLVSGDKMSQKNFFFCLDGGSVVPDKTLLF